ncbi:MAG TPA: site-specific DNA-methyltransferase [Verrucomicrobiae bacterium]
MLRPYYSDEQVTLYHGNMEEVLPQLPMADCIVTDSTYGETALEWDRWVDDWPSIVARNLKRTGSMWCFGSFRMFTSHWAEFEKAFDQVQDRVWEKQNGSSFMTDRFRRVHEFMVHFRHRNVKWEEVFHNDKSLKESGGVRKRIYRQHKPKHFNGYGPALYQSDDNGTRLARSVVYMKNCHGAAINETEKPVGLVRPLIEYSCPVGGLMIDCFSGSGSHLVAARQLGIRSIGIEKRESQCEKAVKRLREEQELNLAPAA